MLRNTVGLCTTTGKVIENAVIRVFINTPEYGFTGVCQASNPNRPNTLSLVPVVSVMISVGFKPVCCSNNPSSKKMESRSVPGITIPWNPEN